PATAASNAFPPACKICRAASVARALIEDTAACRPRTTGRIVRVPDASPVWVIADRAKLTSNTREKLTLKHRRSVFDETSMRTSSEVTISSGASETQQVYCSLCAPLAPDDVFFRTAPSARRKKETRNVTASVA